MEQLTVLLQQLAEKLGTTTEYLWSVLINQAKIEGIVGIIQFIILIIATIGFAYYLNYMSRNWNDIEDTNGEIVHGAVATILGIIITILDILILCTISNIVTAFTNPEYWALQQVLGLFN